MQPVGWEPSMPGLVVATARGVGWGQLVTMICHRDVVGKGTCYIQEFGGQAHAEALYPLNRV